MPHTASAPNTLHACPEGAWLIVAVLSSREKPSCTFQVCSIAATTYPPSSVMGCEEIAPALQVSVIQGMPVYLGTTESTSHLAVYTPGALASLTARPCLPSVWLTVDVPLMRRVPLMYT